MAEGDGERSQRREGTYLRDLSTVTCSKGEERKKGGGGKKKKGAGSVLVICPPSHVVCMESLRAI